DWSWQEDGYKKMAQSLSDHIANNGFENSMNMYKGSMFESSFVDAIESNGVSVGEYIQNKVDAGQYTTFIGEDGMEYASVEIFNSAGEKVGEVFLGHYDDQSAWDTYNGYGTGTSIQFGNMKIDPFGEVRLDTGEIKIYDEDGQGIRGYVVNGEWLEQYIFNPEKEDILKIVSKIEGDGFVYNDLNEYLDVKVIDFANNANYLINGGVLSLSNTYSLDDITEGFIGGNVFLDLNMESFETSLGFTLNGNSRTDLLVKSLTGKNLQGENISLMEQNVAILTVLLSLDNTSAYSYLDSFIEKLLNNLGGKTYEYYSDNREEFTEVFYNAVSGIANPTGYFYSKMLEFCYNNSQKSWDFAKLKKDMENRVALYDEQFDASLMSTEKLRGELSRSFFIIDNCDYENEFGSLEYEEERQKNKILFEKTLSEYIERDDSDLEVSKVILNDISGWLENEIYYKQHALVVESTFMVSNSSDNAVDAAFDFLEDVIALKQNASIYNKELKIEELRDLVVRIKDKLVELNS
ncbi:MAG: hypothetical protein PHQ52_06660, partial [Candidatus Omnitrophica bacterium]|nr:hypothetical protein [Candidatus Omnitrophota bacterium]